MRVGFEIDCVIADRVPDDVLIKVTVIPVTNIF